MLVLPGKVSLFSFLSAFSSLILFSLKNYELIYKPLLDNICISLLAHYVAGNLFHRLLFKDFLYQVAVRSYFLGSVCATGVFVAVLAPATYHLFGWYMCILSIFHYSEFLAIAACNPTTLSIDSFILDHSLSYKMAAVGSWIEFFIERWYFPGLKLYRMLPIIGLVICICGEALRKTAMVTASTNFTHAVASKKTTDHTLVTNGVYRFFRHPSYVGWFYWSIGTQVILANPLCAVIYAVASWNFFNDRITIEELTLINFFGDEYIHYQERVPTGLPFIRGYRITN